ncbi:MAG: GNAT family N-acetyltransferase [Candidatus Latescibacterota bacterium]
MEADTATLFRTRHLRVGPVDDRDLRPTLEVYRQCEDFLSLGPVARASPEMVRTDVEHSRQAGGLYCGIWDGHGLQVGVLDVIPQPRDGTAFLELLMIGRPYRERGYGAEVLAALESYLQSTYSTGVLGAGVQVNNTSAIRFWQSHGFQIGTEQRAMPDGTTTYAMTKALSE